MRMPAKTKVTYSVLLMAYQNNGTVAGSIELVTAYNKVKSRCGSMGYGRWLEKYADSLLADGYGTHDGAIFTLSREAMAAVKEEGARLAGVEKPELVKANRVQKFDTGYFGPGDKMFPTPSRPGAEDFLKLPSLAFGQPHYRS